MKGHRTPTTPCPKCGHILSGAMEHGTGNARPRPGDMTVCIECAGAFLFDELHVREMTKEDFADLEAEERVSLLKAIATVRELHRRERRKGAT